MSGHLLVETLAATIEREDGLSCGGCGSRHVETVADLDGAGDACSCECCLGVWGASFAAEFPDLVTTRHGRRVITRAAFFEAMRRLEAEIASLEQRASPAAQGRGAVRP